MTVTTAERGAARVVSWDRQERRNAWDLETMTAIADAVEEAGSDEQVRCVVLRGAGEHFSAGDDLQSAIEADSAAWAATIEGFQRMTRVVLASPVPVVAAVDGVCVGGALEFAASCDLRLCTDRVRLLTPEIRIGLVMSNAGTLFLPEVLGETAARTNPGAGICVGRKLDSVDWRVIRITDAPIERMDEAVELPLGEIGELIVRGPQVSPRYVTRIEANAQFKIADQNTLWHRTGDIGYFDDQNRFWYCGRKSQRVETAAGPLFTECVEGMFNRHPDVEISALVGLGRAGDQLPVIAVKFRPAVRVGRYSGAGAFADFTRLAATVIPASIICDWMEFEEMPVDVRHNSKINREFLREGVSIGILAEPNLFHPEFVARARQAS